MRISVILAFLIGSAASGMAIPHSSDGSHSNTNAVEARSVPEQTSSNQHQTRDVIVNDGTSKLKSRDYYGGGSIGAEFKAALKSKAH